MSNVKRVLSVILILALALMAFGGLGGCSSEKKPLRILIDLENVTRTDGDYNHNDVCGEALAMEIAQLGGPEDIEVITLPSSWDESRVSERKALLTRLRTEIMAGEGPDVFIVTEAPVPRYGDTEPELQSLFLMPEKTKELGLFYPLDDYIANAQFMEWDKLTPVVMEAGRSKEFGQVLLPLVYDFNTAFFLKDDISYTPTAEGTWEDVLNDETGILKSAILNGRYGSQSDMLGILADYTTSELRFTEEELYQRISGCMAMERQEETATDWPRHYTTAFTVGWDTGYFVDPNPDYGITLGYVFPSELLACQKQQQQLPIKLIPSYSDDGGAVATVHAFAAINGNTKRPDDAFFVLDYLLSKQGQSTSLVYRALAGTGVPTYEGLMTEENPIHLARGDEWSMSDENYEAFCQARDCITHAKFVGRIEWEIHMLLSAAEINERLHQGLDLKEMVHEAYSRMAIEIGE